MSYRSLALAVTALTSLQATSAISGDLPGGVYVAPGGVYIGAGPVYVVPAPNGNGNGHYVAPSYYDYPAPPVVAPPAPAVVAPTTIYGPGGRYYSPPPLSVYGAELPPRPPVAVPYPSYYGNGYGNGHARGYRYGYEPRYGYEQRWQTPY